MTATCYRAMSIFAALFGLALPTRADSVLYSNLGPGDSFIINREYDSSSDFLATEFTAAGSGTLQSIQTPVFSLDSPVNFALYAANDAGSIGELLESWSAPVPGIPGILSTFPSTEHPELTAGTEYRFVISQTSRFQVAWYENNQGITGGIWGGLGANGLGNLLQFLPDSPMPALQLNAAEAPEPSVAILFFSGVVLLALVRVTRRPTESGSPPAPRKCKFAGLEIPVDPGPPFPFWRWARWPTDICLPATRQTL